MTPRQHHTQPRVPLQVLREGGTLTQDRLAQATAVTALTLLNGPLHPAGASVTQAPGVTTRGIHPASTPASSTPTSTRRVRQLKLLTQTLTPFDPSRGREGRRKHGTPPLRSNPDRVLTFTIALTLGLGILGSPTLACVSRLPHPATGHAPHVDSCIKHTLQHPS